MIIAEIGTSHGGSIEKCRQLIKASVESGADAVKLQWVYADEILHPETGFVDFTTVSGNWKVQKNFTDRLKTTPTHSA